MQMLGVDVSRELGPSPLVVKLHNFETVVMIPATYTHACLMPL